MRKEVVRAREEVRRLGGRVLHGVLHEYEWSFRTASSYVPVRTMWMIFPGICLMRLLRLFSAFMFSMLNEFVFTYVSAELGIVLVTDAIVMLVDR